MFEGEGVEEGLEDRELGLEGGDMRSAEVGAVGGVGLRGLGAVGEGAEANAATGGHLAGFTEFEGDSWSGFEVSCGRRMDDYQRGTIEGHVIW